MAVRFLYAIKLVVGNLIVLAVLAGVAEVLARAFYPEFTGHTFSSELSLGKTSYTGDYRGFNTRFATADRYLDLSEFRELVVVVGDSVTFGYGQAYQDIFWVQAQRVSNLFMPNRYAFFGTAAFGHNTADVAEIVSKLVENDLGLPLAYVIYQFNFNDINPYNRIDLHSQGESESHEGEESVFKRFSRFRYAYLNRSTALRLVQHLGGYLRRNPGGTCEERGTFALGPYTWSYGSRGFESESRELWEQFGRDLTRMRNAANSVGAELAILVSPLLFDIDTERLHDHYDAASLDFGCATIDSREALEFAAGEAGIRIIDPTARMKRDFEARAAGNNFQPYYFVGDNNHFNEFAAAHVADSLVEFLVRDRAGETGDDPD